VTTDEEGRFVVAGLATGQYELKPVLPDTLIAGDPMTKLTARVREGGCSSPVIDVTPNGRIRGVVRGTDGLPLRTTVNIVPTDNRPDSVGRIPGMGTVSSNDRGEFFFTGLPAGRYYVGVSLSHAPSRTGPSYPRTYFPGTTDVHNAVPIVVGEALDTGGIDLTLPAPLSKSAFTIVVAPEDAPRNGMLTVCLFQLDDLVRGHSSWDIPAGVPHVIPVVEGQRYEIHVHGDYAEGRLDAEPLVFTATAEDTTVRMKPDAARGLR
jgi:hypothetical protein